MPYFAAKQGLLKTLFDIGLDNEKHGGETLLLEVGPAFCCAAFLHKPAAALSRIWFTTFDEVNQAESLPRIFDAVDNSRLESTILCSAFPQALLFPNKFFHDDYAVLRSLYDEPAQEYFHDRIAEWQMVNVYSMPQAICRLATEAFDNIQFFHAYTPTIKIYNGYVAENQASVHFAEGSFRVLLKKDGQIQLAQTYFFQHPLDVVYYLLKIGIAFGLSQYDLHLVLSGLVEKSSNLFAELQQYFTHIHFAQQPEISLPQSPHPHHYFTSIYNLAACAL